MGPNISIAYHSQVLRQPFFGYQVTCSCTAKAEVRSLCEEMEFAGMFVLAGFFDSKNIFLLKIEFTAIIQSNLSSFMFFILLYSAWQN